MAHAARDVRAAEEPLLAQERAFSGGLMDRAATALAGTVRRRLVVRRGRVVGSTVVALVGPGNNGGDALHALAHLAGRGVRCVAVLTSAEVHGGGLAALTDRGATVLALVDGAPGRRVWVGDALAEAVAADVVLDGLLGIGARGPLREPAAELVRLLGELLDRELAGTGKRADALLPEVVAVDVPSGIGVDDGTVPGPVLRADRTVTFGTAKPGLLLPPAAALAGELELVDLGLAATLAADAAVRRLVADDVPGLWPVPGRTAHKYTRGVVGVVAGTSTYPGAAVLTVAGAQGAGCGMVRYVGPDRVRDAVLAAHPEVVTGGDTDVRVQAWVLGPGLDPADEEQAARARSVLERLGAAGRPEGRVPVVVDAGALALLPDRVPPRVVLTPHAGELARLLSSRGTEVSRDDVDAEPLRHARAAHEATGATVLLKGAVTVVVGPGGTWSQADAPAWLATAGAGDVLAGVLGAVLAGRAGARGGPGGRAGGDPARADDEVAVSAALAALVHGRAAHRACPGGPVTAGDVARALPGTIADLLAGGGRAR
ncbi:NAD(P)H-hydrate epimerase [Cellulomonas carbonis]|uniref:NAD(P)H-hydrate epimerase n=2 Tax=Cellulomonas carbonis TaxID=1386092 RepID=UPI001663E9AE|nr:NAD(P)H-hydrate epimerase [Cellulomonas carbonis]